HAKLRACDRPFWDAILAARARDEWSECDLVVGVQLARCQADIEREQKAVDAEGSVVGVRMNPRVSVLEGLARRQISLMRALRVGGAIPTRDLNDRRGLERTAKRVRAEVAEDGVESLLA